MDSNSQAIVLPRADKVGLFSILKRDVVQWAKRKLPASAGAFDVFRPPLGTGSRNGIATRQGDVNEMIKAFRSYVFACIHVRATEVANKGDFRVTIRRNDDEFDPAPLDHPLSQLMRRPNPRYPKFFLWYLTITYMDLTGNSYWWVARDRMDIPRALWPVPAQRVRIVPGDPAKGEEIIKEYLVRWDGVTPVSVPARDIIHLKHPDPYNPYYDGGSLVMRAAREIDIASFVTDHWHEFFANDAVPASVIILKEVMDSETKKAFVDFWNKEYRGKPGKMAYIEGDAHIETLSKEHELPFIESNKENKAIIRGVFGVPLSKLMEIHEVMARATMNLADYQFQEQTIDPLLTMIGQQLTIDLAGEFFSDEYVITHKSTIPSDNELEANIDAINLGSGATYINEVRKRQGKDPVPGGDEPLVNAMMVPLSQVVNPPTTDVTPPAPPPPAKRQPSLESPEYQEHASIFTKSIRDITEAAKTAIWKSHDRLRAKAELRTMKKLKHYFVELGKEMAKHIRDHHKKSAETDALNIDIANVLSALQEILTEETGKTLAQAFLEFVRIYGIEGVVYAPNSPAVHLAIARVNAKTVSIPATLHDELTRVLDEGLRLQETAEELARRVDRFFSDTADFRSLRIARTVSNYAVNEGSRIAAKTAGLRRKIWLTRRDDKVRDPLHTSMDGVEVPIEGKFKLMNGDSLEVPGDPNASKGESVINCRCTALFAAKEE